MRRGLFLPTKGLTDSGAARSRQLQISSPALVDECDVDCRAWANLLLHRQGSHLQPRSHVVG